jgi:hypothetical protein
MRWVHLGDSADLEAVKGRRYRATVSVSRSIPAADVLAYLRDHGWGDVQIFDTLAGDRFPADWGDVEVADPNASHRFLRGEATRTGESTTIPASHWLLTVYDIRHSYVLDPSVSPAPAPMPSPGRAAVGRVVAVFSVLALAGAGAAAAVYVTQRPRHRRRTF